MMKGTPCSSRRRATLKTLRKTHYLARSSNPAKRVSCLGVKQTGRFLRHPTPHPSHPRKGLYISWQLRPDRLYKFVKRRRSNSHDRVMKGSVERQRK